MTAVLDGDEREGKMGKPLTEFQEWSRADVEAFINRPEICEDMEVEFKGAIEFTNDKLNDKFKATLSSTISAFANTQGGYLILGVEEIKADGKTTYRIDSGIPGDTYDRTKIIDILTFITNPPYQDIQVSAVPWNEKHVIFIVYIPEFTVTPIQAKNNIFYRRNDHACVPMLEDQVRALYFKSRHPDIHLSLQAVGQRPLEFEGSKFIVAKIRCEIINHSHIRAHDIKIDVRFSGGIKILTINGRLVRGPKSIQISFANHQFAGPLFGLEPRSFNLARDPRDPTEYGGSEFAFEYRRNTRGLDQYDLLNGDSILCTIYADDSPKKEKSFRLDELVAPSEPYEYFHPIGG